MKAFELSRAWAIRVSFQQNLAVAFRRQASKTRRDFLAGKLSDTGFWATRDRQDAAFETRIAHIWSMKT